MAVALSFRYPLWGLVGQTAVNLIIAAVPSLMVAAFLAGLRRGSLTPISVLGMSVVIVGLAFAAWVRPAGRKFLILALLLIFGIGALLHAGRARIEAHDERVLLTMRNATLAAKEVAMRERERIADEIHDRLGHQLTAIEIQARLLLSHPGDEHAVARRAAMVRDQAARAIDDVHTIIRPTALATERYEPNAGSHGSLSTRVRDVAESLNVHIDCKIDDSIKDAPFDVQYVLLRVAQEGITNAARHAPGQGVWIRMRHVHNVIRVRLRNSLVDSHHPGSGRGIHSLSRRVTQAGGSMSTVRDTARAQFLVEVTLPLPSTGRSA